MRKTTTLPCALAAATARDGNGTGIVSAKQLHASISKGEGMRKWIALCLVALAVSVAPAAWAKCVTGTDQVSEEGKYGKVKFKEPHWGVSKTGAGIPQFKGRIYFRPRNGGCYVSVLPRNGDLLVGTGDLEHPGCDADDWGWWDIKWTDDGTNGQFDCTVDFLKAQYKITLIHNSDGTWEMCLD